MDMDLLDGLKSPSDSLNAEETHENKSSKFLSQENILFLYCFARSLHFWRVSWTSGGGWTSWTSPSAECPTKPPGGGAWTLGLSESPTDPLHEGGHWTFEKVDSCKMGGCYKVTFVAIPCTSPRARCFSRTRARRGPWSRHVALASAPLFEV